MHVESTRFPRSSADCSTSILGAVWQEYTPAGVDGACNAVELEICHDELAVGIDFEEMEALDFKRSRSEVGIDPLPCDVVASNEDAESLRDDGWVALRRLDEHLLRWDSDSAKL